jgi:hypothetical protein
MIDPQLSLAISVYGNKGIFALLLGSGISRSASIPTGWEIVQDLICKIAHLRDESCEPNADDWFRRTFDAEPNYSDILDGLAKSPAERLQILRGYFEPTEEEWSEGQKKPTRAHHAIAGLVSKGYVRVIITTNFDRLLEEALGERGVQPTVIHSADAVEGALPLAHSACSIIKINGDYLDTRLKNTRGELEQYPPALDKLLDQVFDEYGLIIAGWSAEWDIALRAALERCPSRRFTTFWAQRGTLSPKAKDLAALRRAAMLNIPDADSFFSELASNVIALESLAASDPVSGKVAVARLKRYLPRPEHNIALADLVHAETERVKRALTEPRFSTEAREVPITGELILERLTAYQAETDVLLQLSVCGAYWATKVQHQTFLQSFRRIADQSTPEVGLSVWFHLRQYPSLLLLYGMGLAALAKSNYAFLKALFEIRIRKDPFKPEAQAAVALHNLAIMDRGIQKLLPDRQREHTPLSNHLFDFLREPLRDYLPDDHNYDDTFDWFEYLIALTYCDLQNSEAKLSDEKQRDPDFYLWAPVSRFGWKATDKSIVAKTAISADGEIPVEVAVALRNGFFAAKSETDSGKYVQVKGAVDRLIALVRREWAIYF